jgi:hypothetical protein
MTVIEVRWYSLDGSCLPLFITPIFLLFMLVLGNLCLRRVSKQTALRQEELLLVYIMLVVSCTFCGHDTLQNLFGCIGHPFEFASPENQWSKIFFRFLPRWLLVTNKGALTDFYSGKVSIYSPQGLQDLRSWIGPLAAWGVFFVTLTCLYLCLTILVRRAWIENEKLSFPLVQLPMAITADDAGTVIFRDVRFWCGFALAFSISGLNGLHELIPTLPEMQVKLFQLQPYFATKPWSAIGSTTSSFYPFMIGIGFLMPLDLSFSCWFFFIASRIFRITGDAYGWDTGNNNGFPYFGEQAAGAWLGLGVMLVYAGRSYWAQMAKSVWTGAKSPDTAEAIRVRAAVVGVAVCISILGLFAMAMGMSPWVAIAFFGIVILLGVVITRVRAEFGAPHEIVFVNPVQVLVTVFGTRAIGAQDLTLLSVLYWFNRGYRNHPMPNQLEAFKMLDHRQAVRFRGLVGVLIFAFVISLISTYWANLHVVYEAGATAKALGFKSWVGWESYNRLAAWLTNPTAPASAGLYYIIGGFLLTVLLSSVRTAWIEWPLHPAGYALALSYAMEYFWLPILIAWALKAVITRYGGGRAYRLAVPFFLGLILGDYTIGAIWALVGPLMGTLTYKIYI